MCEGVCTCIHTGYTQSKRGVTVCVCTPHTHTHTQVVQVRAVVPGSTVNSEGFIYNNTDLITVTYWKWYMYLYNSFFRPNTPFPLTPFPLPLLPRVNIPAFFFNCKCFLFFRPFFLCIIRS